MQQKTKAQKAAAAMSGGGKKGKKKVKDSDSKQKGKNLKRKSSASPVPTTPKSRKKGDANKTPSRPIIHPRFREGGGGSDHQVKLLPQLSAPIDMDLQVKQEKAAVSSNAYSCQLCDFSTARLNVLVLHQKSCRGNRYIHFCHHKYQYYQNFEYFV